MKNIDEQIAKTQAQIKQAFEDWIWKDPDRRDFGKCNQQCGELFK